MAFPMTAEDVGDLMLVSGMVIGKPGPAGFFVRTEGNRVSFIESTDSVTVGQRVRVIGPLQVAEMPVFDGWEREFLGGVEPDWDLLRLYYVRANAVTVLP